MALPPVVAGGKFRILERHQWKGMDFAQQAESICVSSRRNTLWNISVSMRPASVRGVFQLVRSFYPAAREIRLHARNENRNGAESKRRYPPWLSRI
ncbi:hypothetical protein MJK71_21640 [Escherichia coli]|nr:hypothetical protein MJK71_21640 [Escherichia coli]